MGKILVSFKRSENDLENEIRTRGKRDLSAWVKDACEDRIKREDGSTEVKNEVKKEEKKESSFSDFGIADFD